MIEVTTLIAVILFWIGWDLMAMRNEVKDMLRSMQSTLETIAANTQKSN